jgi:hypothetical protein
LKKKEGRTMNRFAYAGITVAFFVVSAALHWACGWAAFAAEAAGRSEVPAVAEFAAQMGRDTFATWQGEFLQVLWQVAGLAWFLHLGSAAAQARDERVERKLDALLHYLALDQERDEIDRTGAA